MKDSVTDRRFVPDGWHTVTPRIDTPYGDRRCMVEDAWGNAWQIATHLKGRDSA
jgi:uncharacterized glyoxalase superfamily protein PhnB